MANRKMTISKTKIAKSLSYTKASSVKQLGLAAAFMLSATNVYALGLGSLEINSNLDQPLNGQIDLRIADGDDANSVTAAIASIEDFESLGIDYPDYLKDINLSVSTDGASSVLLVSSNGVIIKEPFIHFLVRVEWSGGSFLREYTALIDPPVYAAASPQSISEPREVGTDQSYLTGTEDTPEVSSETYDDVVSDDQESYEADVQNDEVAGDAPLIDDNFYSDDETATAVENGADTQLSDARYGPVASGESLSVIASDLQSQFPDLSIYQIMQVLFQENQGSFIDGNINGLIQGAILNIGDLNAIRAVDVAESKAFFTNQVNEWDPSSLISSSDETLNVGQDNYNDTEEDFSFDSSSVSGAENDRFQVGASSEEDNFVSSDQGSNQDGEVLALRKEITQLETSLASSELENQDLNERISLLEGQLADMNRLVDLNVVSPDLAVLESTLKDQASTEAFVEDDTSDVDSALDEFLTDTDDAVSDVAGDLDEFTTDVTDVIEDGVDDSGLGEFADDVADGVSDVVDSGDSLLDSVVEEVEDATSVIDTSSKPDPTPVVAEASVFDKIKSALFGGGLWKIIAGIGGLIAVGLGFIFLRNRRADEEFEISMLSIESNSQSVNESNNSSSSDHSMSMSQSVADDEAGSDKETSFLTVYSDSDAVVQADEVDPVAEADVYIAYGRDEQAEEVLLDGVVSHPDRIDIKVKLLSLYHKRQNAEGFERIAEELYSQRAALTGDMWQQVSQMGKEVAPQNPLFELDGDDLSTAIDTDSELQLEGDNIDEVPVEPQSNSTDLDDLDEVLTIDDESELIVDSLVDDDSIQLVNFDDGRSEVSELDEIEIDALDFSGSSESALIDDELVEQNSPVDVPEASFDDGDDDNVLEFNLDQAEADDDAGERDFSDAPEVSDLEIDPDYDEARTQYELAKVFVDLGDEDGARKILEDLVANSDTSESVMSDSTALLDSINS